MEKRNLKISDICLLVLIIFLLTYIAIITKRLEDLERTNNYLGINDLRDVMINISKNKYINNTFTCVNFTNEFIRQMNEKGYYAGYVKGTTPNSIKDNVLHAWVEIWIEPQGGRIVKIEDGYEEK